MSQQRLIIYFTDDRNPPRHLDITDLQGEVVEPVTAPENLEATVEDTAEDRGLFLIWDTVLRASGYHVYIEGEQVTDEPITTTSFSQLPFELPDGVYEAYVTAVAGDFESDPSDPVTFTFDFGSRNYEWEETENVVEVRDMPTTGVNISHEWEETDNIVSLAALVAPANFELTSIGYTSAEFSWDAVGGIDSYTLHADPVGGGEEITQEGITDTQGTISGLTDGTEYDFWVTSVKDGEESGPSDVIREETNIDVLSVEFSESDNFELSVVNNENIESLTFDESDNLTLDTDVE